MSRLAMQMTLYSPLSLTHPLLEVNVSRESELMKSEMQIMTAQLGSTVATDESPRSDKGRREEERDSVFVFVRVRPRDKRIFASSAKN